VGEHAFDKADGQGKEYYKDGGRYEGEERREGGTEGGTEGQGKSVSTSLFQLIILGLYILQIHMYLYIYIIYFTSTGSFKKGEKHGPGIFYYPDDSR